MNLNFKISATYLGNATKVDDLPVSKNTNIASLETIDRREILRRLLDTLSPVDFIGAIADMGEFGGVKQKHAIVLIVEKVLEAAKLNRWGLCRKDDFVYCYNAKYWQVLDSEELITFLGEAAEKMGWSILDSRHHQFRKNLYQQFLSAANMPAPDYDRNKVLINLLNGTFEVTLQKQALRMHIESDFLKYVLPFEYDPKAACPTFMHFLSKVLPEPDAQAVLAEYIGYVFTRSMKLEKVLLLYGSGANGKSVFFEIVNALLGRENVSNCSLSALKEEHNRALIANKLLNYGSEIKAAGIEHDEFKTLASNEPINARQKYGKSFLMEHYAKLAFNCNELPKDVQHNEAYFRRFLIIGFDVTIPEHERDPDLADKIINNELPGVFNWVLEGLKRLLKNRKFTHCEKSRKALEKYRTESDTAWQFMDEAEYEESADNFKSLKELYKEYQDHCRENGNHPLSSRKFADRVRQRGFQVERRGPGMMVYCSR